jgi:hypothetical protein
MDKRVDNYKLSGSVEIDDKLLSTQIVEKENL